MSDCPRCQLTLQPQDYEGVSVLFCATCWGHWVEHAALSKILAKQDYAFDDTERGSVIFRDWSDAATGVDLDRLKAASCPVCSQLMTTGPFAKDCPVEVDRCDDHGVWLDTAEVKQLQVYYETK